MFVEYRLRKHSDSLVDWLSLDSGLTAIEAGTVVFALSHTNQRDLVKMQVDDRWTPLHVLPQ